MKTVTIDGQEWEIVNTVVDHDYAIMTFRRKIEKPLAVVKVWIDEETSLADFTVPIETAGYDIQDHMPWISLAAPIAAYYPEYKYMAVDGDGDVYLFQNLPKFDGGNWGMYDEELNFMLKLPKAAIPKDCSTALVEVRHG